MIENIVGGLIGKAMAGGAAKRDRANIDEMKKKQTISIIAEHLYKSAFVVDKEINAFACLVNLESIS